MKQRLKGGNGWVMLSEWKTTKYQRWLYNGTQQMVGEPEGEQRSPGEKP